MADGDRYRPFSGPAWRLGSNGSDFTMSAPGGGRERASGAGGSTDPVITIADDDAQDAGMGCEELELMEQLENIQKVAASWLAKLPEHAYTEKMRSSAETFLVDLTTTISAIGLPDLSARPTPEQIDHLANQFKELNHDIGDFLKKVDGSDDGSTQQEPSLASAAKKPRTT